MLHYVFYDENREVTEGRIDAPHSQDAIRALAALAIDFGFVHAEFAGHSGVIIGSMTVSESGRPIWEVEPHIPTDQSYLASEWPDPDARPRY